MKKQISSKSTFLIFSILLCLLVVSWVFAWHPPTATPPGDNVPAPLNVSLIAQAKLGALGIGTDELPTGDIKLKVGGKAYVETQGTAEKEVITADRKIITGTGLSSLPDIDNLTANRTLSVKNYSFGCSGTDALQLINIDTNEKICVATGMGIQGLPGPPGPRGVQGPPGPSAPPLPPVECTYHNKTFIREDFCTTSCTTMKGGSCGVTPYCGTLENPEYCWAYQQCENDGFWTNFTPKCVREPQDCREYDSCK